MGERLTQGDIDKIKKEIEYRTLVVRKEAIEAVSEARAQGDLSENFEYYAAKKDKNKTIKKAKSVLWHTDYDMLFMVLDIVYIKRFLNL